MSELIRREDAINAMAELQGIAQSKAELAGISKAWKMIKKMPTVDAVPVSYIYKRAKELKNDDMMYAYTVLNSLIANYRAYGERKKEK